MKQIWEFTRDLVNAYIEDDGFTKGAALAYYTTFSIAPIIIIVVAVAGFVFGEEAVRGELYDQLSGLLGSETAASIQDMVKASSQSDGNFFATMISIGALVFGATTAFNQLKLSLDAIWEIESKPKNGVIGFLKARGTAFALVMGLAFLLLISLVVNALAVGLSNVIGEYFSLIGEITLAIVSLVISLALTTLIFAVIFKELPDVRVRWTEVFWGALFTAILFSLGRFAIGYYIGNSSVTDGFGAAGPLVALLVWTYYSSQIVFLGAEFIWVLGRNNGHPVLPSKDAVKVVKKTKKLEAQEAERAERRAAKGGAPVGDHPNDKVLPGGEVPPADDKSGGATGYPEGDSDDGAPSADDRAGDPSWPSVGKAAQAKR